MKLVIDEMILEDASVVLEEIAEKITQGYTNGIVGCSTTTWYVEDND